MSLKVRKAVIPAAGLGTRMWPLTSGTPKEMLLVCGKPIIHYAVQEALDAGINDICIVSRRGKEAIQAYFDSRFASASAGNSSRHFVKNCRIVFVNQEAPKGIGDAMLCARNFVADESFALIIPDQLFFGKVGAITQLITKKVPAKATISSLVRIAAAERKFFPGARSFVYKAHPTEPDLVVITAIEPAEVRTQNSTDETILGFGRTIYPPEVFRALGPDFADPRTEEIDLLRTFEALLNEIPSFGVVLQGEAADLGTVDGYNHFLSSINGGYRTE
jgi:UTP--glucose-1-phosphate uridylyltransferase